MSGTGQAGHGAAAVRLLGLLALVLGLVGMHGLASAHHAPAAGPRPAPSVVAQAPSPPHDRAGTHQHDPSTSVTAAGATATAVLSDLAGAGPVLPACGDDCPTGLAVLCAAVLAAAAAAALVAAAARRRTPATPAGGRPRARAPAAVWRRVPGPDPVAELCVSRT